VTNLWPVESNPLARAFADAKRDALASRSGRLGIPAPAYWDDWLYELFPDYCTAPFAQRHAEFWQHVDGISADSTPDPFVSPWPRGGAKSTSAELGGVKAGVTGRRRYAWYVSETQDQADKHVENMAALLESDSVAKHYPDHAERKVNKFGASRGWRRNRLRTAGGFTVDALGLDTAARGLKVEEQRPDLIILDDIDNRHDTPATTAKKIATITTSILPAGANNVAVWVIQNLIIPDGFVSRLVDGRADYLSRRIVSGPHPAIRDFKWEYVEDGETGTRRAMITEGEATWEGQSLAVCQHLIDTIGILAFLRECQHEVKSRGEGLALKYNEAKHLEDLTDEDCRALVKLGRPFGGLDFGDWRFGLNLRASDTQGRLHQIAEYFSQRESLEHRARVITCILTGYGVPGSVPLRGDAANPTDIREINLAFKRIESPYHVHAVTSENKSRKTAVERENDLFQRNALFYRRGVSSQVQAVVNARWKALDYPGSPPDLRHWRLGYNASSGGTEMEGSRLQWEAAHWGYPVPKEGEAQEQDPDDNTADGADLIAADRYAIMSHLRPGKEKDEAKPKDRNVDNSGKLERMFEAAEKERKRQEREAKRILKRMRRAS
jgi:hypothetical protein